MDWQGMNGIMRVKDNQVFRVFVLLNGQEMCELSLLRSRASDKLLGSDGVCSTDCSIFIVILSPFYTLLSDAW